jgi:pSer/pThr/pTyr-binding forkhead associated (FHA) protein
MSSCPVLVYVDPAGCHRSFALTDRGVVTLGRRPEADVCLPWDAGISRLHAELIHRAGLPVDGRRRLRDGDLITIGRTSLTFCGPSSNASEGEAGENVDVTMSLPEMRPAWSYSEQQQQILRELCRPLCEDGEGVRPASDLEIADALALGEHVVDSELDSVAHSFGYAQLATDERRLRTALTALRSGLVDSSD